MIATALLGTPLAVARDYVSVVGSSTVYPFATVVAERFGKRSTFKTPKVESTGSGGGLKLFCQGVGVATPDITNSSRSESMGGVGDLGEKLLEVRVKEAWFFRQN